MPRKARYDIAAMDLTTECTECAYKIPPAELVRLDADRMRCSSCGAAFIPKPKGTWSQLGGSSWPLS